MTKKTCVACGEKIGAIKFYVKTTDGGYVCNRCYVDSGLSPSGTSGLAGVIPANSDEVKSIVEKNRNAGAIRGEFSPDLKVSLYAEFDTKNGLFRIPKYNRNAIFKTEDIVSYEVIEDSDKITKGGVGRAVAGGFLFGGVGAIVGATTAKQKKVVEHLEVIVNIQDAQKTILPINIVITDTPMEIGSMGLNLRLQELKKLVQALDRYANPVEQTPEHIQALSPADEIRKYKSLFDDGIITEEEFDAKKKELLNI